MAIKLNFSKYKKFIGLPFEMIMKNMGIKNNISLINCPTPNGNKYVVKGEGHPSSLAHKVISECIYKEIEILNIN